MKLTAIVALCLGLTTTVTRFGQVRAADEPTKLSQSPLKFRVNTNVLKNAFHTRDQETLNVFKDLDVPAPEDSGLTNLKMSVKPNDSINFDDFDYTLNLQTDNFGAETNELQIVGSGELNGEAFEFSGPIDKLRMKYALGEKYNEDMKYNSLVFEEEEWVVDINPDSFTFKGAAVEGAVLVDLLKKEIDSVKENLLEANHENHKQLEQFPMDVVVPFVLVVYGTQFAEKIDFTEKFIEFGFSLSHFNMLHDKHKKLLKNIEGSFYNEKNFFGQEAFVQLNIDDNFFNSMSALLVAIDQMFSMRELSKLNKNAKPFIQMLTTSTIGTVLPQFTEEYGADKKIDVVVSPSHALFLDGLPNSKISGIYVDKNGNWKVRLNMNIQVNLEQSEDQWIPVRNIYATFVFTFKATMDQKDPSNKKVVMLPKRIELSAIKVMKDDEEMSMEQMMIQSMASIQFEQAQKMFREIPIPVGDIMAKNPAELQCFGFNIADLDISYKKSQAQFTAYYKTIEEPDKDICDAFKKELQKTPKKILEQMKGGDDSPFQKGLKKFAQLGHNEMMKDAEADKLKREREKTAEYMKSDL